MIENRSDNEIHKVADDTRKDNLFQKDPAVTLVRSSIKKLHNQMWILGKLGFEVCPLFHDLGPAADELVHHPLQVHQLKLLTDIKNFNAQKILEKNPSYLTMR